VIIHQVLSRSEEFVEFGGDYYDQRNKPRTVARLVRRLHRLGYQVDLKAVEGVSEGTVSVELTQQAHEPGSGNQAIPAKDQSTVKPKRRRGRPCKCLERGIVCEHRRSEEVNLLKERTHNAAKFS